VGNHRYYRICVNGKKDHSTGGYTAQYIRENILNDNFDPIKYITHNNYDINNIFNISFVSIKTSNDRTTKNIEDIIIFTYENGIKLNNIKFCMIHYSTRLADEFCNNVINLKSILSNNIISFDDTHITQPIKTGLHGEYVYKFKGWKTK